MTIATATIVRTHQPPKKTSKHAKNLLFYVILASSACASLAEKKTPVTSRYKLAHSESGDLYSHDLACGRSVQHVALAREGLLPTEGCNCAVQLYMIQRYQRQLCKAFFLTSRLDSPGQSCMSLFLYVSVFHFQYPTFVLAAGCHLLPRGLRI